jgi:ABC-type antimicrobial peptide transport system permease subunit
MLMVILERTKELGMIMAIGMNRFRVFKMIMYETTMLAIVGGILGILVSVLFTSYFGRVGIDISSVAKGFESLGYSSVMHPVLEFIDYVEVIIMVMLTGIIASIFPTIRALKMKPVEAIRD